MTLWALSYSLSSCCFAFNPSFPFLPLTHVPLHFLPSTSCPSDRSSSSMPPQTQAMPSGCSSCSLNSPSGRTPAMTRHRLCYPPTPPSWSLHQMVPLQGRLWAQYPQTTSRVRVLSPHKPLSSWGSHVAREVCTLQLACSPAWPRSQPTWQRCIYPLSSSEPGTR